MRSPLRLQWWRLLLVWLAVPVAFAAAVATEAARHGGEFWFIMPADPAQPSSWGRGLWWLWTNGFPVLAATLALAPTVAVALTLLAIVSRGSASPNAPPP